MIISFIALLLYCTNSYGVESGTVRMQINGGTAWTNINISESYAECESLNSPTSTLGTSALKAHLTTDADWSAMAIFSVVNMEVQLIILQKLQLEILQEFIMQEVIGHKQQVF